MAKREKPPVGAVLALFGYDPETGTIFDRRTGRGGECLSP